MILEDLDSKEQIFKDFFEWLFDDSKITAKEIQLEKEVDITLAPYYLDSNIYYPKQFKNFFETRAMKRLERVSQVSLAIDLNPNLYQNRLEHSKGVYYRKLEEMVYNFQDYKWRQKVEKENLKLYLIAELIKMAGHDIGHFPFSHAFEEQVFHCHGIHEEAGKKIMLEDPEIINVLNIISPDLPEILEELYNIKFWNFSEHDESNYDVDRLDYIQRDSLYWGTPINLPHLKYKTVSVKTDEAGKVLKNTDNSILVTSSSDKTIDVYSYSDLSKIEKLLELREDGYKNKIYMVPYSHIRESSIGVFFNSLLETPSNCGNELINYINTVKNTDIKNIDLNLLLNWDDIKVYSEIIDIAQNHENGNIRKLATLVIPKLNGFLNFIYSCINLKSPQKQYTDSEKDFLRKVKKIIYGNNELSQNMKNQNFIAENTLYVENPSSEYNDEILQYFLSNQLILKQNCKIKAYNPNNPIYIKNLDGKIYELSQHPKRKFDWKTRISYNKSLYTYIPYLKFKGVSDKEIELIKNKFQQLGQIGQNFNFTEHKCVVNMQPLQNGHNFSKVFKELEL